MVKRNINFKSWQWDKLKALSEKSGAPVSVLIRRAIDAYLKKAKP